MGVISSRNRHEKAQLEKTENFSKCLLVEKENSFQSCQDNQVRSQEVLKALVLNQLNQQGQKIKSLLKSVSNENPFFIKIASISLLSQVKAYYFGGMFFDERRMFLDQVEAWEYLQSKIQNVRIEWKGEMFEIPVRLEPLIFNWSTVPKSLKVEKVQWKEEELQATG